MKKDKKRQKNGQFAKNLLNWNTDSIWKILQRSYTICICHECLPTFEKSAAEASVINTLVQKHDENGGPGSLYLPFTSQVPELLLPLK
ncbi:hypothetical protein TYRP_013493 [Tyrophagus putrescentiae]|nr:hypothetical protein TYRP_013493 [Tyrophagus putrescentiae]